MAQLDRFLNVMVSNHADSINLIENDVAVLQVEGVPRPITRQALSSQQLLMLLREIAPESAAEQLAEGLPTAFHYTHAGTVFSVRTTVESGQVVRVDRCLCTRARLERCERRCER